MDHNDSIADRNTKTRNDERGSGAWDRGKRGDDRKAVQAASKGLQGRAASPGEPCAAPCAATWSLSSLFLLGAQENNDSGPNTTVLLHFIGMAEQAKFDLVKRERIP